MPEEMTPNLPSQPVVGDAIDQNPVASVDPVTPVVNPETVPQNQDKSDAMTYPLGSQNAQPVTEAQVPAEDHRSILDRIMGIFNKGNKSEEPENPPVASSASETPSV